MKKLGKWSWIIITILIVGVTIYFFSSRNKKGSVLITTVQVGEVREELILTGGVRAEKYAALSFPTSGKISGVYVKEGEWVKKGRSITSLDKTVLNATYQQALNTYKNYQAAAESTLDSVKNHANDETFAIKATRTAAEVARDSAYDAVTASKYNLDNSTIYAPFEGLIASLPFTSSGVNVGYTDVQVEILDPTSIYFEVEADQSEVINLKEKQKVEIVLDSYRNKTISGEVSFVGFTPKPGVSGIVYKIRVNFVGNGISEIAPKVGMTGDAKFFLSSKENVLYVPPKFIHSDKIGKYVNLGSKSKRTSVVAGVENEERVEIVSGIKEGDVLYE